MGYVILQDKFHVRTCKGFSDYLGEALVFNTKLDAEREKAILTLLGHENLSVRKVRYIMELIDDDIV